MTNMRSEGFFTYSRSAYTNFPHEERKMRRLFIARRAYSTHFTRRVVKILFPHIEAENVIFPFRSRAGMRHFRSGVRKNNIFAIVCAKNTHWHTSFECTYVSNIFTRHILFQQIAYKFHTTVINKAIF